MKRPCIKCGDEWYVDVDTDWDKPYICPRCDTAHVKKRLRKQRKKKKEVVTTEKYIPGKKTRRKAKKKALRAGKQMSA